MEGSQRLDRERARRRAQLPLLGWVALLSAAWGCAEPVHPLATRCLEALDYHAPAHGRVLCFDRGPAADGWEVTIRFAEEDASGSPARRSFTCEYPSDDRWTFRRIAVDGEDLRERELALVNAELFLRDLRRSPQRFERSGRLDSVSAGPRMRGTKPD